MNRQVQYIYMITNPKGRIYIGKTNNIERRIMDYKCISTASQQPSMYNSIKQHGWNKHKFSIIWSGQATNNQIFRLEKFFIKKYDSYNNGLNANGGGRGVGSKEGHPWYGKKHSKETIEKIKKALTNKPKKGNYTKSKEQIEKLRQSGIIFWDKVKDMGCSNKDYGIHPMTKYKLLQKTGINHWDTYCKIYNIG